MAFPLLLLLLLLFLLLLIVTGLNTLTPDEPMFGFNVHGEVTAVSSLIFYDEKSKDHSTRFLLKDHTNALQMVYIFSSHKSGLPILKVGDDITILNASFKLSDRHGGFTIQASHDMNSTWLIRPKSSLARIEPTHRF
ncbi:hypothetical protein BCR41DRAFT_371304 [Lobosporangium transversale]|uniref:Uncharacterized protein n=1 Tax=Lobosporangium transversale TaxID=64571 RepID=A0A1Y2GPM2_9FUNG|nr:hypothetical protein BCR41DRAFT_371304 [Lobosporangium transversale]ORZ13779.1 hypothetical protein BCR41DRAFT_371304 [Lobosporangium transversale]|eukprot:XP_021880563.1 hypothetical protein BCR41DRAFT_371304 [Lobosporangium transversale]